MRGGNLVDFGFYRNKEADRFNAVKKPTRVDSKSSCRVPVYTNMSLSTDGCRTKPIILIQPPYPELSL